MKLYPALKCHMGQWEYYSVKMQMDDLASEVHFASEVHDDKTLDEAIQRELSLSRAKNEIAKFLALRNDRFFSSIVVAALGGAPEFYSVTISDDPKFEILSDSGIDESFGVLAFRTGTKEGVNYYALDGQHRLAAIKSLLDRENEDLPVPKGFGNEEVSVLIVVPNKQSQREFLEGYRRLFSSLNRHAKPTKMHTNIIMDEDDVYAILTRRLISGHKFFQFEGRDGEHSVVKTDAGEQLSSNVTYFTTITTLYKINTRLLLSPTRIANGDADKSFLQIRPDEEVIDNLYAELALYWDCLLETIDDLKNNPGTMRQHSANNGEEIQDHMFFWPIGQHLLARIARDLLSESKRIRDPDNPTAKSVKNALRPLQLIDWSLHSPPWAHFVLVPSSAAPFWKMRNEDRKQVMEHAYIMLRWLTCLDDWDDETFEEMRNEWKFRLSPPMDNTEEVQIWEALKKKHVEIGEITN